LTASRRLGRWGLLAGILLALTYTRQGWAGEHQHELGVDFGLSVLGISDKETADVGAGFGLHYGYGITDQFNLTVNLQYSVVALGVFPTDPPTHPSTLWNADAGLEYVLDVLRCWVPYFGGLLGGYWLRGGTVGSLILPGAEVTIGLDYLLTPRWAVGFEASEHVLFTDMNLYTSYTTVFARTEFLWGK
jgi:hypothetical protein